MQLPLKRRELLALALSAAGSATLARANADTLAPPAPATTSEGMALISEAYATVGYPVSDSVADEVRRKLSGYPGDFAAARAVALPNFVAPSMSLTAPVGIVHAPYIPPPKQPAPVQPAPAGGQMPSDNQVRPLPVPQSAVQN